MRLTCILTVALVFAVVAHSLAAEEPESAGGSGVRREWPEWHGPNRDNVSPETGLLKEWPEGGPQLLWTASGCGKGYSTVSIAGGTIYTAGKVGDETLVFAFDLNGHLQWKSPNGTSWKASEDTRWARGYDGSRATPTVDDGLVYHLNETGNLAAFDAGTGKKVWSLNVLEKFGAKLSMYGCAESVLIDGNNLLCYPGGSKGYMVALDKKTGQVVWANQDSGDPAAYCSPVLVEFGGVRQIVTMTAEAVIGVEAGTGELLWRYEHTNGRKINAVTPLYEDGYVYATLRYGAGGVLLRLKASEGQVEAEKVWGERTSGQPARRRGAGGWVHLRQRSSEERVVLPRFPHGS